VAACGGGGGSGSSNQAQASPPGVDAQGQPLASIPALPPGAIAITQYREFATSQTGNTSFLNFDVIHEIPSGYKTTWYTYKDGAWVALQPATIIGGQRPVAQNGFGATPANVVVLAEPQ
jgi:hypothetical protein